MSNRKAKHKALIQLCASAEYNTVTTEKQKFMEKQVVAELEDHRMTLGISTGAILNAQISEAARLREAEATETRARLTELVAEQASNPSRTVTLWNEGEKTATSHFRERMIDIIKRQKLKILQKSLPADATDENRLARKKFLGQLIDLAAALMVDEVGASDEKEDYLYDYDDEDDK
ncbi:MAG: hypothetical protein M1840_000803 [Geoglossum simile]|nr:MAG: hypothetical protein M1840_000803 [Geoglossum simile]